MLLFAALLTVAAPPARGIDFTLPVPDGYEIVQDLDRAGDGDDVVVASRSVRVSVARRPPFSSDMTQEQCAALAAKASPNAQAVAQGGALCRYRSVDGAGRETRTFLVSDAMRSFATTCRGEPGADLDAACTPFVDGFNIVRPASFFAGGLALPMLDGYVVDAVATKDAVSLTRELVAGKNATSSRVRTTVRLAALPAKPGPWREQATCRTLADYEAKISGMRVDDAKLLDEPLPGSCALTLSSPSVPEAATSMVAFTVAGRAYEIDCVHPRGDVAGEASCAAALASTKRPLGVEMRNGGAAVDIPAGFAVVDEERMDPKSRSHVASGLMLFARGSEVVTVEPGMPTPDGWGAAGCKSIEGSAVFRAEAARSTCSYEIDGRRHVFITSAASLGIKLTCAAMTPAACTAFAGAVRATHPASTIVGGVVIPVPRGYDRVGAVALEGEGFDVQKQAMFVSSQGGQPPVLVSVDVDGAGVVVRAGSHVARVDVGEGAAAAAVRSAIVAGIH